MNIAPFGLRLRTFAATSLFVMAGLFGWNATSDAERLPEAVRRALRAHPDMLTAAANLRAAQQGYEQASAGRLPTLDLRFGRGREETENASTRAVGHGDRTLQRREAALTLRQNVYDGQQVRSEMERQNFRVDSARARLDEAGEIVSLRVVEAYLDFLRDGELVALSRDNVARHQATLEKTQLRFKSGVGQRADVEQAEARHALARSSLVAAQGNEQDSAARYQRVVGRLPAALVMPDPPGRVMPPTLDAAKQEGIENGYGLKAARAEVNAAQAGVRTVRADLQPRFDVELAANRNRDIAGVPGPSNDATAMLVMRYNLFRGGADQARVREAMERETAAAENANNSLQFTEESVARAWHALVTARDRLSHLESHARAIDRVLVAYQSQFELGRRSLLDLLNAETELFQARSSLTTGRAELRLNEYRLLAAMASLVRTLGLAAELENMDARAPSDAKVNPDAR